MRRPVQPVGPLAIAAQRDQYMAPFMAARGGRMVPVSGGTIYEPNPINSLAAGLDQVGARLREDAKAEEAKAKLAANQEAARRVVNGGMSQKEALAQGGGPTLKADSLATVGGNPFGLDQPDLAYSNYLIDSGDPNAGVAAAAKARQPEKMHTLAPGAALYQGSQRVAYNPKPVAESAIERAAREAGFPNVFEYQKALKKAGRPTNNINVHPDKRVSAGNEVVGKGLGEEFLALQKASSGAADTLGRIRRAEQMLDGLSTGALAEGAQFLKRYGKYLGVDLEALGVTDDTAQAEAFRSLGMGFVMDTIALTKGAVSDTEMKKMEAATIGLSRTPEGNRLILDFARRVAQRQQALALLARDYARSSPDKMIDIGWYDAREKYIAENPIIDDATQREIDALIGGASTDATPAPSKAAIPQRFVGMDQTTLDDYLLTNGFESMSPEEVLWFYDRFWGQN